MWQTDEIRKSYASNSVGVEYKTKKHDGFDYKFHISFFYWRENFGDS